MPLNSVSHAPFLALAMQVRSDHCHDEHGNERTYDLPLIHGAAERKAHRPPPLRGARFAD